MSHAFESFTLTSCSVLMTRPADGAECVGHDASCSGNIKSSWKQTVNKQRMTPPPPLNIFSGLEINISDNEALVVHENPFEDLVCQSDYFIACSWLKSCCFSLFGEKKYGSS